LTTPANRKPNGANGNWLHGKTIKERDWGKRSEGPGIK
jgi:hypothetical protein